MIYVPEYIAERSGGMWEVGVQADCIFLKRFSLVESRKAEF